MIEIRPIVQATGPDNPARQISVTNWNIGHALTAAPDSIIGTDGTGVEAEYPLAYFASAADLADAIADINEDLEGYVTEVELTAALTNYSLVGHHHPISDIDGLQAALDAKADDSDLAGYATDAELAAGLATKANVSHTHIIADVTGLQAALDGKVDDSEMAGYATDAELSAGLATKSDVGHIHTVFTSVAAGFVPASGGGTVNFLRADGTFAAPAGGGGGITDGDKGDVVVSGSGATLTVESATPADGSFNVTGSVTATTSITANSLVAASTTARNPGFLAYANGGNEYGMEVGYLGGPYGTRVFAPQAQVVEICGLTVGGTLQSDFTHWASFNSAGLALAGNIVATGTITSGGSSLATVSQLANYLPLTGGTLTGRLTFGGAGSFAASSIYKDAALGLVVAAASGSSYDFLLTTPGGGTLLSVQAGTATIHFPGNLTCAGTITVTDEAYGPSWDGSTQVPTKNALYDKIQTLGGGSGAYVLKTGDTMSGDLIVGANTIGLAALTLGNASYNATINFNHGTPGLGSIIGPKDTYHGIVHNCDEHAFLNTAGSTEFATINAAGVTVPDQAYGVAWDGNLSVPTKNAVYDKIQALTIGGGATLADGDYGDVLVSGSGAAMTVQSAAGDFVATGSVTARTLQAAGAFYAAGPVQVQSWYDTGVDQGNIAALLPGAVYKPLKITGTTVNIAATAEVASFASTGLTVWGTIAATGTITSGGSTLATVSQLANYLPLTGGTLSGDLTVSGDNNEIRVANTAGYRLKLRPEPGSDAMSILSLNAAENAFGSIGHYGTYHVFSAGASPVEVGRFNSTGLAVTGKVSASNGVNANKDGAAINSTARNPGVYSFDNAGNVAGMETGYNGSAFVNRVFTLPGTGVTIGSLAASATLQSQFTDWAYFNVSGLAVTGDITATSSIGAPWGAFSSGVTVGGSAVATVSQLANYLPLTGGTLSGPLDFDTGVRLQYSGGYYCQDADNTLFRSRSSAATYASLGSGGLSITASLIANGNSHSFGTAAAGATGLQVSFHAPLTQTDIYFNSYTGGGQQDASIHAARNVGLYLNGNPHLKLRAGGVDIATVDASGIDLVTGKTYRINGVAIGGGGGLTDGDKGDVVVSGGGTVFTVESATPADGTFEVCPNAAVSLMSIGGGASTIAGMSFLKGGTNFGNIIVRPDGQLAHESTTHTFKAMVGSPTFATIDATGLAVTGTIAASGAITSGGSTLATVSQLANYLPLTGGTVSGNLGLNNAAGVTLYLTAGSGAHSIAGDANLVIASNGGIYSDASAHNWRSAAGAASYATLNSTGLALAAGKTLSGSGGLAISGDATVSGQVTAANFYSTGVVASRIQNSGASVPVGASGVGLELYVTLGASRLQSFDRTGTAFAPMQLAASTITAEGPLSVPDDAYAAGWNGSTAVPTKNAVYDKIEAVVATIPAAPSTVISDVAYAASWDTVTTIAPSKNAVYDKIETLVSADALKANILATITAKTATYTLVQGDAGGALTMNGTTLTLNLANLTAGTMVIVRNIHASSPVTVALNSCTLLKNGATASAAGTLAAGGVITLMCWGSSVWTATGSGLT